MYQYNKIPIYAECGGMLVLGNSLMNTHGNSFPMAGILPFKAKEGKLKIGYREMHAISEGLITKKGDILIGHEFHRWELDIEHFKNSSNQYQQFMNNIGSNLYSPSKCCLTLSNKYLL